MRSVGAKIGHAFVYKLMFSEYVSCPNPDPDLYRAATVRAAVLGAEREKVRP